MLFGTRTSIPNQSPTLMPLSSSKSVFEMYAGSLVTTVGQILPCLVAMCPYQGASHLVHVFLCLVTALSLTVNSEKSSETQKQAT